MRIFIICSLFMDICAAYRVLLVFPFPFKSHAIFGEAFVRHLLDAGHEVTYITPYPIDTKPMLHQVEVSSERIFDNFLNLKNLFGRDLKHNRWKIFLLLKKVADEMATNTNLRAFLNDTNQVFDVAIVEWMDHEIYSGFAAVFDCPFIWFFPYDQYIEIFRLIHTPPNPAFTSNMRTINVPPFSFLQRAQELWFTITMLFNRFHYFYLSEEETYKEIFEPAMKKRGKVLPDYSAVKYNASLAFSSSHISLRFLTEVPIALKMIGGFHIKTPVDKLPKDLQEIMDQSKQGVILFSLGSHLTFGGLPQLVTDIVNMFSKLDYTVLWKTNEENLTLPTNVITRSWLPQVSILAHPNCILFITHGGILSITESVHHRVPIIGIPAFADQFVNIKVAVKNGFAKEVKISMTMADDLLHAIKEVIHEPRYRTHVQEISRIYHSRLTTPERELVHWTEEVVKSGGAPHLRSPALSMPYYQQYYLDLIVTLIIVFTASLYVIRKTLSSVYRTSLLKKNN